MRKALTVARWEYIERVRSKIFLISLIVLPVIMISMGIIPGLLVGQEGDRPRVIGLAGLAGGKQFRFGEMMAQFRTTENDPLYVIRPVGLVGGGESVRDEGDRLVAAGEIDGFCFITLNRSDRYEAEYRSNGGDLQTAGRIQEALRTLAAEDTLAALGMSSATLDWMREAASVKAIRLSGSGGEQEYDEQGFVRMFFSAYVFLMMLFFMILSSGQLLVRSVIEEKANRIVELLVSSCSATELMSGKILGLSGLGFTQLTVWGCVGFLLSSVFPFRMAPGGDFLLLILYFVLGYLFYAGIFIAVGSPVTTEQEAQHVTSYLVIILVIPLILTVPAIQNPEAEWIKVLSYIPLLTPTMMGLRLSLGEASASEVILTVVVMVFSIYLSMLVAGKIFRLAILSTGRRPGLREIAGWIRSGH